MIVEDNTSNESFLWDSNTFYQFINSYIYIYYRIECFDDFEW